MANGRKIMPVSLSMDFELAEIASASACFPESKIKLCSVHLLRNLR